MVMTVNGESMSAPVAVSACVAMALILRFDSLRSHRDSPPPEASSYTNFMIRRFICAAISTVVSVVFTSFILPIINLEPSLVLGVYGIRTDHMWQGVVKMVESLTPLITSKALSKQFLLGYWQAPITEELVFPACMIPLLLSAGFRIYSAIFLCPILLLGEMYVRHNRSYLRASLIVGLQLGYTVIFCAYALFLFIRTGHLAAPLFAHIFCYYMGFPVLHARGKGLVIAPFLVGVVGFVSLLFPITKPLMYNDRTDDCPFWLGYCLWN